MSASDRPFRLAVVLSHPTQYYSPWFRHLASESGLALKVFYLWDFGVVQKTDRTFQTDFAWDIPLLDGYEYEFIPNRSPDPGTHHFRGLDNPHIVGKIKEWRSDALLIFGYAYLTHLRIMTSPSLAKIPFLFRGDSHELSPAAGWKSLVSRKLRGLLFCRFRSFLAVGEANKGYFLKSGVPDRKIHVVPHCVDNDRFQLSAIQSETDGFQWKRELGIPEQAKVILFAGKFEEKKRPLDLLIAFQHYKAKRPKGVHLGEDDHTRRHGNEANDSCGDRAEGIASSHSVCLLYVGSGILEETLRTAAGDDLNRTVFFAPFQNQTEMPKVYASADLLVLPSFGRGETWGLAVNEAMNLACPVIVSSHVGCGPDLVIEGETGWSFPAGSIPALEEVLTQALSDPERLKMMGQAAKSHIEKYSYRAATNALLQTLQHSVKGSLSL